MFRYIGSCGRVAIAEGRLTPLADQLTSDWAQRADLALQVQYITCILFNVVSLKAEHFKKLQLISI